MIGLCTDHYLSVITQGKLNFSTLNVRQVGWGECDMCKKELFFKLAKIEISVKAILASQQIADLPVPNLKVDITEGGPK